MTHEPIPVPPDIAAYHDDLFDPICKYLAEQGAVEDPTRVTQLSFHVEAGKCMTVTAIEEDASV